MHTVRVEFYTDNNIRHVYYVHTKYSNIIRSYYRSNHHRYIYAILIDQPHVMCYKTAAEIVHSLGYDAYGPYKWMKKVDFTYVDDAAVKVRSSLFYSFGCGMMDAMLIHYYYKTLKHTMHVCIVDDLVIYKNKYINDDAIAQIQSDVQHMYQIRGITCNITVKMNSTLQIRADHYTFNVHDGEYLENIIFNLAKYK